MDHSGRIEKIRRALDGKGLDALLVTNLTNVRYLTGFSGTNGQLLITRGVATFMSDPRYAARAQTLVTGADISIYPDRLRDVLPDRLATASVERLGIEAATMTVAQRDELVDDLDIEVIATKGVVEDLRRVKDADEVRLIREAIAISDSAFSWVLDRLVPGVEERRIALELEVRMREAGADDVSFPPIVGSGSLSAHIHHTASDRTLEKGDIVLLDFGCTREGYCSDLTRTVVLGAATDEQLDMYALVLEAHNSGLASIRSDVRATDVDAAARAVIAEAGHGNHFGHGLGHGVGLDIHEAPAMNRISEETLRTGDVVTVEPGVYVPEVGGVRIEDCVLVGHDGAEVLGSAPKDRLLEL